MEKTSGAFLLYKQVSLGSSVNQIALSSDAQWLLVALQDSRILVWSLTALKIVATLKGHTEAVETVALSLDNRIIVSGSDDCTVRIWDFESGKLRAVLEGHTKEVRALALSDCGRRLVTVSSDNTVLVWNTANGALDLAIDHAHFSHHAEGIRGVHLSANGEQLVFTALPNDFCVWLLPPIEKVAVASYPDSRYTNAKVLLVGDSGVGKTGLAHRLAENRFNPTVSSDAVWATQLCIPSDTDQTIEQREVWLWDFAGQSDYRLIHQLFMDETALAILVFNPQSENPFEGLSQWDNDIQRAARRTFAKLLVAGRCDRGGLTVSKAAVEQFKIERGFSEYHETSALTGAGCEELKQSVFKRIPWSEIRGRRRRKYSDSSRRKLLE